MAGIAGEKVAALPTFPLTAVAAAQ